MELTCKARLHNSKNCPPESTRCDASKPIAVHKNMQDLKFSVGPDEAKEFPLETLVAATRCATAPNIELVVGS